MDPGNGAVVGCHRQAAEDEDRDPQDEDADAGGPGQLACQVLDPQQFLYADLDQAQHQQNAGIDGGDAGKQQKVLAIELGGAVEDLAESKRAQVGFHARFLWNQRRALAGILAQQ